MAEPSDEVGLAVDPQWNWHPAVPIPNSPLFELPPRPVAILRWFAKSWLRPSMTLLVLGSATLTWLFLQPALERSVSFEIGWIAQILLRNLVLTVVVAGSLHLYFHTLRKQGAQHRFTKPGAERKNAKFTWGDQVLDNMFWTLASGVPVWSAYEVLYLWAYANGHLPTLDWAGDPALLLEAGLASDCRVGDNLNSAMAPTVVRRPEDHFYWDASRHRLLCAGAWVWRDHHVERSIATPTEAPRGGRPLHHRESGTSRGEQPPFERALVELLGVARTTSAICGSAACGGRWRT